MRYNILINSKSNVGGDNPSNYKYNFDFSSFQEGDYELGFNFNTKGLKEVQATPILIADNTTQDLSIIPLNLTDVSLNYEYALSNGVDYETSQSSNNNSNYGFHAFNDTTTIYISALDTYDSTSGNYLGSIITSTTTGDILGEHIQIKLPYNLQLSSFKILNSSVNDNNGLIKNFSLLGSNDNIIWKVITTDIFSTRAIQTEETFITANTEFYTYYRLIIQDSYPGVVSSNTTCQLARISLFGKTYPINNASLLQIELDGLGATKKTYTTTDLTTAKSSNIIGTISLSKLSYYNTSYKFNNLIAISSKPLSSEITINLKKSNGELFNIGEDYLMVLSFLKK